MKYTLIKWLGTIIVLAVGIYIAFNATYGWNVKDITFYKISLPEHAYLLEDGQRVRVVVGLVFSNKDDAKKSYKERSVIRNILGDSFSSMGSESFKAKSIYETKFKLFMELKKGGFDIEQVVFDTQALVL